MLLENRQKYILQILADLKEASNQELLDKIEVKFEKISRITLIRDLNFLTKSGLVAKHGSGRGIHYKLAAGNLLVDIDVEEYFKEEPDKRPIKKLPLTFDTDFWKNSVLESELVEFENLTKIFKSNIKKFTGNALKKELERITIEFSWKSSLIEGNTYSLLDTERLIEANEEAKGHTHEEAVMILNHKVALEYAWEKPGYFKTLTLKKIEEVHSLIIKDLKVVKGLRKRPVGIIGTAYKPYDNYFQIRESMENLCNVINKLKRPLQKVMTAIAGLSYIQAFEDGNKRTSRLIGNAILLAHGCCPLSYRSIDEKEYKKALIIFYEQHSLSYFKELILQQYKFAVENYF